MEPKPVIVKLNQHSKLDFNISGMSFPNQALAKLISAKLTHNNLNTSLIFKLQTYTSIPKFSVTLCLYVTVSHGCIALS